MKFPWQRPVSAKGEQARATYRAANPYGMDRDTHKTEGNCMCHTCAYWTSVGAISLSFLMLSYAFIYARAGDRDWVGWFDCGWSGLLIFGFMWYWERRFQ